MFLVGLDGQIRVDPSVESIERAQVINCITLTGQSSFMHYLGVIRTKGVRVIYLNAVPDHRLRMLFQDPIPGLLEVVVFNGVDVRWIPKNVKLTVRKTYGIDTGEFHTLRIDHWNASMSKTIETFKGHTLEIGGFRPQHEHILVRLLNAAIVRSVNRLAYTPQWRDLSHIRCERLGELYTDSYPFPRGVRKLICGDPRYFPDNEASERTHRRKIHKLLGSTSLSESIIENIATM